MNENMDPSDRHLVPSRMRTLINALARALVDDVDAVSVTVLSDLESTVIQLQVAPADMGRVIGLQGRTARSLRAIVSASTAKLTHRFALDIVEEDRRAIE